VDIRERLIADMEKHLPGLWLPARPRDSEALVLRTTLLWTQRDLARGYYRMARGYIGLKQWPAAMSYLERARNIGRKLVEQNPSMDDFANELLITLNFCGYVSDKLGQTAAALSYHKEDADFARARFPNAPDKLALVLNAIAWDYATSDDSDVRNGTMAVELAEEAVRLTKRQNADWIDTLAAAYAENQQFDKAVTTEKEAIALLKADTEIKRYMTNFMQKVNLYQSNKPYHEPKAD
jgi:tetratricopeptide (TPR) repeat protein